MKKLFLAFLAVFFLASGAWGAGTCSYIGKDSDGTTSVYQWDWTSDASGDVSGGDDITVSGYLTGVRFVPSTTAAPTALYDVVVNDENGYDILIGTGANLAQSVTDSGNYRTPLTTDGGFPPLINETLTVVVSNAGNAKQGTIYIFIK